MADARHQAAQLGAALSATWRNLLRAALDPYRPELHYMRGPGPKWRAKHGIPEPDSIAATAGLLSAAT